MIVQHFLLRKCSILIIIYGFIFYYTLFRKLFSIMLKKCQASCTRFLHHGYFHFNSPQIKHGCKMTFDVANITAVILVPTIIFAVFRSATCLTFWHIFGSRWLLGWFSYLKLASSFTHSFLLLTVDYFALSISIKCEKTTIILKHLLRVVDLEFYLSSYFIPITAMTNMSRITIIGILLKNYILMRDSWLLHPIQLDSSGCYFVL